MRSVIAGILAVTLAGCSPWLTTASKTDGNANGCAADDFATGNVVFFGFSDNLGPGTIMERYAGKGVGPAYLIGNIVSSQASTVVHRGVDWSCALGDSVGRAFNANSAVGLLPVDASVNAKVARASRMDVTVDSVRWDDLLAGPYQTIVDHLSDASLRADLLGGGYLVVSRALAAKGIKVTALFEESIGASVKTDLGDGQKILKQGKVTAVVNLTWEGTTTLVITAPSEVYIAGQFRRFGAGSSPAGDGNLNATDPARQMLVRTGG
jgi:hypothetical protein